MALSLIFEDIGANWPSFTFFCAAPGPPAAPESRSLAGRLVFWMGAAPGALGGIGAIDEGILSLSLTGLGAWTAPARGKVDAGTTW